MSAVSKNKKKTVNPMDKKIPENPRFRDVKAKVNSGSSMLKYLAKVEELKANYRFRTDEIFRRMKITTFAQLVIQVMGSRVARMEERAQTRADIDRLEDEIRELEAIEANAKRDGDDAEQIPTSNGDELAYPDGRPHSPAPSLALTEGDFGIQRPDTVRSTMQSVIVGVGEMASRDMPATEEGTVRLDVSADPEDEFSMFEDSPFLLLDIRDDDSYNSCRIIGAKHYPTAMLSRTLNFFTKEMLEYINKEAKVVIIYDEVENLAPNAATTLVQRGVDNLFMLSGGLKVAHQKFPAGLITGKLPISCIPPPASNAKKSRKPEQKYHSETLQQDFTSMDIANLHRQLEDIFLSSDTCSRMSSRASTTRTLATDRSTPWK